MPHTDPPDDLPDWLSDADSSGGLDLSGLLAAGEPAASPPEAAPAPVPEPVTPTTGVESLNLQEPPAKQLANRAATGMPFVYGAVITLGPKTAAGAVQIEHDIPPGLKILAAGPAISGTRGRTLVWRFAPGEIKSQLPIRLKAVPLGNTKPSDHGNATFRVSSITQFSSVVPVIRSSASLEFVGPSRFEIGHAASHTLRIKNTGACPLTNIAVQVRAGGVSLLGETRFAYAAIPCGGEVTATVHVDSGTAGSGTVRAELTAHPTTQATTEAACEITAPKLEASFAVPAKWRVNRDHSLTLTVRNAGTAAARMVDVWLAVPPSWEVKNAPDSFDASTRLFFAHADEIPAGSAFELPVTVTPTLPGTGQFRLTAEDTLARCECELTATAEIDAADSHGILERFVREVEFAAEENTGEPAAPATGQGREYPHVIFAVADTEYAFPLHAVREIGRPPVSTPVPGSPDWLVGVTNLRGDIVSMVDLRAFLDELPGSNSHERRLLVVTAPDSDLSAGLLVDRVRGIRSIPPERVRTPTAPINARCASYMAGVTALDRRSVVVLIPERLLLAPEFLPFGSS